MKRALLFITILVMSTNGIGQVRTVINCDEILSIDQMDSAEHSLERVVRAWLSQGRDTFIKANEKCLATAAPSSSFQIQLDIDYSGRLWSALVRNDDLDPDCSRQIDFSFLEQIDWPALSKDGHSSCYRLFFPFLVNWK